MTFTEHCTSACWSVDIAGIPCGSHLQKVFIYISSVVFIFHLLPANEFLIVYGAPLCTHLLSVLEVFAGFYL